MLIGQYKIHPNFLIENQSESDLYVQIRQPTKIQNKNRICATWHIRLLIGHIQEADSPIQSRITKIRKRKIDVKHADIAFELSVTLNVKPIDFFACLCSYFSYVLYIQYASSKPKPVRVQGPIWVVYSYERGE